MSWYLLSDYIGCYNAAFHLFTSKLSGLWPWHLSHSHNYPASNSATQHSDIYRGNSTLTLFEPDCPWISYRGAFYLPDAQFARSPKNRSISGLSRLFSFHPWHQNNRLHMARHLLIDVKFCARSRKHVHTFWNRTFIATNRCNLWQNWHPYQGLNHWSLWEQVCIKPLLPI